MALSFNLAAIPLKYVAFPVVVGLAAGTGALAAYVTTGSAPVAKEPVAIVAALPSASTASVPAVTTEITPAKSDKKPSCEQQTWPYIDNRCIARKGDKGSEPARAVRFVRRRATAKAGYRAGKARNSLPVTACCAVLVSHRKPMRR